MRTGRAHGVRILLAALALGSGLITGCGGMGGIRATRSATRIPGRSPGTRHLEYVVHQGAMSVYDADHGFRLLERVPLPGVEDVRGVVASPRTGMLYIAWGGYGGPGTHGHLLAYDLRDGTIGLRRTYSRGVDNMAINPAGTRIYMPDGERSADNVWSVIAARSGVVTGVIHGGRSPHETIVGLSGTRVYLAGIRSRYLDVASTATDRVIKRVGPLRAGVRPITINGRETLAYTTATHDLGFQVSSLRTGRVLYTVGFGPGFRRDLNGSHTPSHGISLTPDERQLWVMDWPHHHVHVFDVSQVPRRAPREIANIRLIHDFSDGWIQMSRDGCYAYIGDSGDVISTTTFKPVAYLPPLRTTKESIEVDWRRGRPVATSSRTGIGYVTRGADPPPPACPS